VLADLLASSALAAALFLPSAASADDADDDDAADGFGVGGFSSLASESVTSTSRCTK
jgi:hypothetical protein